MNWFLNRALFFLNIGLAATLNLTPLIQEIIIHVAENFRKNQSLVGSLR